MFDNDAFLKEEIGECATQKIDSVEDGRDLCEVVFAEPSGGKGDEGEPEEEVEVRPENAPCDVVDGVEHVVMVVPVDAEVDKAEDIAQEDWSYWLKGDPGWVVGHLHLEHHDGDDNGENAI